MHEAITKLKQNRHKNNVTEKRWKEIQMSLKKDSKILLITIFSKNPKC